MRLTKEAIEKAKLPSMGRKEHFIRDDVVRGLGVRITYGGAKSFVFEARIKGRSRRLTLGHWPDLNLVLARQRAMEIRTRIAKGEDPATEAIDARKEITLEELIELYMERHAKPHKRSASLDERLFKHYVPAGWYARKLSDIARSDMANLHAKIGEIHGHYMANRTLALLHVAFNLAHTWELFKSDNPAQGIKPFKEHKRERFLSPEELQKVNAALLEEPDWRWRTYFPIALMLGTRKSELLSMRWTDIDMQQRTWRIPETKTGNTHLLPLPSPAMSMLENLPSRGQSEWVFPGGNLTKTPQRHENAPDIALTNSDARHGNDNSSDFRASVDTHSRRAANHIVEPGKAWDRIRRRAGVPDVRIHDLRHTLASWLVAQGFNLPLIGRALNHTQTATTARYAHLALDPVRAALEQTAALMVGVDGK